MMGNALLEQVAAEENIEDMYLTFLVAGEEYAVSIEFVTEIVGMQKITPVPDVPEFVKGVINLRGRVIPIMDVRLRFGLNQKEYDERTPIVVLEVDEAPTGLVVDEVREVLEIPKNNIAPPPKWQGGEKGVILGMGRVGDDRVCIILDVKKLLYSEEIDLSGLTREVSNE